MELAVRLNSFAICQDENLHVFANEINADYQSLKTLFKLIKLPEEIKSKEIANPTVPFCVLIIIADEESSDKQIEMYNEALETYKDNRKTRDEYIIEQKIRTIENYKYVNNKYARAYFLLRDANLTEEQRERIRRCSEENPSTYVEGKTAARKSKVYYEDSCSGSYFENQFNFLKNEIRSVSNLLQHLYSRGNGFDMQTTYPYQQTISPNTIHQYIPLQEMYQHMYQQAQMSRPEQPQSWDCSGDPKNPNK